MIKAAALGKIKPAKLNEQSVAKNADALWCSFLNIADNTTAPPDKPTPQQVPILIKNIENKTGLLILTININNKRIVKIT